MREDLARLERELAQIEQAIAELEALRGVHPAAEVERKISELQQKAKALRASIAVGGNVTNSNLIVGSWNRITNFFSRSTEEQRTQRNRQIMLERVKEFWVEGVLENSLHGQVLIELGMEERPVQVDNRPWDMLLQTPKRPPRPLPQGTKMVQVFDEMNQALLILGEPGSGKTTMLLELARDTITRAERDLTWPIPVVFNLSSWAASQQPIGKWLIDELNAKYLIPKKIARSWVENDELLPLLDGLDEVALEGREACVKALNQFRQEHLMPLVVCSRIADYEDLTARLNLQGALLLQSLTQRQIDEYLIRAGIELLAVRKTLQHDPTLAELAQSPLMLSIMVLAYRGKSVEELQQLDTISERRAHLFNTYTEEMFKRRGIEPPYSPEQTIQWLAWLAQNMKQHSQKVFLIEQLQPSWLATRWQRWTYVLGSRLIGGLISWGILGIIFSTSRELLESFPSVINEMLESFFLIDVLIYFMILFLFFIILPALTNGFIDIFKFELSSQSIEIRKAYLPWHANVLIYVLMWGFMCGVIGGTIVDIIVISFLGLFFGLIFGLVWGLRGRKRSYTSDIQTVETLSWSWVNARKNGVSGVIWGVIWGLILIVLTTILAVWIEMPNLSFGQIVDGVLVGGVIGGLIGAVFGGLNSNVVEIKTLPNQGIKLSIRNSVFAAVVVGLIWELISWITWRQTSGPGAGLLLGLVAALWYGGLDVIQHYILRLILYFKGYTPRNYADFLDYAAKLIFLRKVGGYIFIHQILLEHFAAMNNEEP